MKTINSVLLLLLCTMLANLGAHAGEVKDPIQDFFEHNKPYKLPPNLTDEERWLAERQSDNVLMFRLDLNGDGKDEIFLSYENETNARAGNLWTDYISKGDKYIRSEDIPSLPPGNLFLKKCEKTGRYRLFTVFPGGKDDPLVLCEVVVSKNSVKTRTIAKIKISPDKDGVTDFNADAVFLLLKSPYKLVITKGNVKKLKKAMRLPPTLYRPDSSKKTETIDPGIDNGTASHRRREILACLPAAAALPAAAQAGETRLGPA